MGPISPARRAIPAIAALLGAAGVALGALAAHAEGPAHLGTASSFLLFHAPAILALDAWRGSSRLMMVAEAMLLIGVILFSGTLGLGGLTDIQISPSPAPLGGILMILGWLTAALAFASAPRRL
jgi:uncharacterized membrane protein YgdD (TMEM256/DUF423 family)